MGGRREFSRCNGGNLSPVPDQHLCYPSVFMYHISAGFIGRANTSESQRINDHLIMEAYNFVVSNTLTISLRNVGGLNVSMTGADFFLNDLPLTPDDGCNSH